MPSQQIVRARRGGWCDQEFAHPGEIQPGDVVLVTTYMPRDENVSDFGVAPWTRTRTCAWCVARDMGSDYYLDRANPELVAKWRALTAASSTTGQESD